MHDRCRWSGTVDTLVSGYLRQCDKARTSAALGATIVGIFRKWRWVAQAANASMKLPIGMRIPMPRAQNFYNACPDWRIVKSCATFNRLAPAEYKKAHQFVISWGGLFSGSRGPAHCIGKGRRQF
jgi:hypothetical protein